MNTPESKLCSCRPIAFYYRQTARSGTDREAREALLKLAAEYEQLREWVRGQGMIPPRFDAPVGWIADIGALPVTEFQAGIATHN